MARKAKHDKRNKAALAARVAIRAASVSHAVAYTRGHTHQPSQILSGVCISGKSPKREYHAVRVTNWQAFGASEVGSRPMDRRTNYKSPRTLRSSNIGAAVKFEAPKAIGPKVAPVRLARGVYLTHTGSIVTGKVG